MLGHDCNHSPIGVAMNILNLLDLAPALDELKPKAQRVLRGDGANLILFSFAPGQVLAEHMAAHPITIQCIDGVLDFVCENETVRLHPGVIIHLDSRIEHRVDCPDEAPGKNVLLLTMLTGEKHS
ncbi:cupin domain-containing protein [Corynebacterium felinum]|uniref:Quercetin dioxygenase-like cupin family protein n=2 Tax=Corynebacterium felinum TaxID=131318 RepID=A0ABU2BBL7_9CORY|nr:cupin domain-containing protein [Corynebacterium felinum]MDF5819826.1 cupin domain-containing protein [Corynebacterium felinum]MDR7356032.1 quercetin dioxygenase-like cupin family protein [Corynebacterium felinum]